MLKHKNIIDKLTKEQKIALLTDTKEFFGKEIEEMKIPSIHMSELWASNQRGGLAGLFPSAKSLANSWNEELFASVAKGLATMGCQGGDNLFLLPSTNAASSVYGAELSEEPYLSGALVSAMARGLYSAGAQYCLKMPVLSPKDTRFLDEKPDLSVIYDRIVRPFKRVSSVGGANLMLASLDEQTGEYKSANQWAKAMAKPSGMEEIVKVDDGDMTTGALMEGKHLLGGSTLVLSTALDNYNRIYRSMEEGGATAQELQMTMADGAAISEAMIDEALDKKLSLAEACCASIDEMSREEIEALAYEAAYQSIVLLKNENKALPSPKAEKVAFVGDIINDGDDRGYVGFKDKIIEAVSAGKSTVVGFESGYSMAHSVSEEEIEPACALARQATLTVAFVGFGQSREEGLPVNARLSLPGNQIAMLTRLRENSRRLVVVVCAECLPDMSFDHLADAIILVPPVGSEVAYALWGIISGAKNPVGRLAYAGYYNTDTYVREVQSRKKIGRQSVGPFIGNRYVDSNGDGTRYPLGYGLSYTSFEYSKLKMDKAGNIRLNVKNTGKRSGCEVVQLYVGAVSSDRIRPKKELKGALRIDLAAGEKRTLKFSLRDLEIYDTLSGEAVFEAAEYKISLSSSFSNEILSTVVKMGEGRLEKQASRLSDYLQNVSNIVSESYTMEAYCKPMKTKSKFRSFGAILLFTLLFADIVYAISCLFLEIDFMWYLTPFIIINGAFFVLSLIFLIIGGARSKKLRRLLAEREKTANSEMYKNIEKTDAKEIDQLFEGEFDAVLDSFDEGVEEINVKDEASYAYMAVDTDIPTLAKDLEAHFKEFGIVISQKTARHILSAVMTSRLLVVRSNFGISGDRFGEILARFFGSDPHGERLLSGKWTRKSLLRDENGRHAPLMQAILSAKNDPEAPSFFAIDGAYLEDLGDMLMPYVQYFGNPEAQHIVADEDSSVVLPTSLWFVVCPAKGQSIDKIPAFIANLATLVDIEGTGCKEVMNKTKKGNVTCTQIEALVFRAKKACQIKEDVWKGVDRLESFVNEKKPYHIGNKMFLQLERYMAVYTSCNGEMHEAMDYATSSKLLPGILNVLSSCEDVADTDLTHVLESIFGEEFSYMSCGLIKRRIFEKGAGAEKPMQSAAPKNVAPSKPEPPKEEQPKSEASFVEEENDIFGEMPDFGGADNKAANVNEEPIQGEENNVE